MANSNVDPSTGQFIDPMFAVIIAAAVAETVVSWTKGADLPSLFSIFVVSVGYINLLLSWFGYHKSTQRKPIRGGLRFIVTVVLLPLYLLTIIMFDKQFAYIAYVYAVIFFLWSFWEYLKYKEHGEERSFWKLQFRTFNILVYLAALYSFLAGIDWLSFMGKWLINNSDIISLSLITFAILFLRISKSAGKEDSHAAKIKKEINSLLFGERIEDQST